MLSVLVPKYLKYILSVSHSTCTQELNNYCGNLWTVGLSFPLVPAYFALSLFSLKLT